jgi:multidrug transporter EmrE-like cation transporter
MQYIWLLISAVANVGAGITLKMLATKHSTFIPLSLAVIVAVALPLAFYFVAFLAYGKSLQSFPTSIAYIAITTSTFVMLLCYGVLVEKQIIDLRMILGVVLIVAGLALFVRE